MDENCRFLIKVFADEEQVSFCELAFCEGKVIRGNKTCVEYYSSFPCKRINSNNCENYKIEFI